MFWPSAVRAISIHIDISDPTYFSINPMFFVRVCLLMTPQFDPAIRVTWTKAPLSLEKGSTELAFRAARNMKHTRNRHWRKQECQAYVSSKYCTFCLLQPERYVMARQCTPACCVQLREGSLRQDGKCCMTPESELMRFTSSRAALAAS